MTSNVITLFTSTTQSVSADGSACPLRNLHLTDNDAATWAKSVKAAAIRRNRSWALHVIRTYEDQDYRSLKTAFTIIRQTPKNNLIRQRADQLMHRLGLA